MGLWGSFQCKFWVRTNLQVPSNGSSWVHGTGLCFFWVSSHCDNDVAYHLTFSGGRPHLAATAVMQDSVTRVPCGKPNPRNAVLEGKLVLHAWPRNLRLRILYAFSSFSIRNSVTWRTDSYTLGTFFFFFLSLSKSYTDLNCLQFC